MNGITLVYLFFAVIMIAGSLVIYSALSAGSRYDREVAEAYRQSWLEMEELSNRVHEYCLDEMNLEAIRRKLYLGELKATGRAVISVEIDRREEYLAKLGIYDEQVNNLIHLIKADLKYGYGMS